MQSCCSTTAAHGLIQNNFHFLYWTNNENEWKNYSRRVMTEMNGDNEKIQLHLPLKSNWFVTIRMNGAVFHLLCSFSFKWSNYMGRKKDDLITINMPNVKWNRSTCNSRWPIFSLLCIENDEIKQSQTGIVYILMASQTLWIVFFFC